LSAVLHTGSEQDATKHERHREEMVAFQEAAYNCIISDGLPSSLINLKMWLAGVRVTYLKLKVHALQCGLFRVFLFVSSGRLKRT